MSRAALTGAAVLCMIFAAHLAADAQRASIPLTVKRHGPLVMYYVEGRIKGSGPCRLALEPSVDTLQISHALAGRLGLDGKAGVLALSVSIAGRDLGTVPAEIFEPRDSYFASDPPDAILGFSSLYGWIATLDFPTQQFHIEKGSLTDYGNTIRYDRSDDGYPLLPVQINDLHALGQLSLYSAITLSLPGDIAAQLGVSQDRLKIGRMTINGVTDDIMVAEHDGTLLVGALETRFTSVRVSAVFEYPEIGYNLFQQSPISIDTVNRLIVAGERVAVTALEKRAAHVPNLDEGASDLWAAFNAGSNDVQMILILSPT